MEIDLKVLGKQQVTATTETKKMRLSEHAQSMVFQLFTKNVYSNPIGTVVREITSNCFDSHIEAGVDNTPVLIKKTHDKQTDTNYISFIDYGVGMSPDRVENVYGVYFESTKRENNNEIGGFGIGGKTPLAYKRYTGEGEGEYDNSFFVITNYDGIKYYYNVYEGVESPEWTLFHQEETTERNGTEIRIPVLYRDIDKFEDELIRQLYYFEGIVFEGFSDKIKNDYQIVRGKNFLYRGDDVDSRMHVCLGKVYYPIDFNVLGLNSYDYQIPVAIDVPIGKINVTVSRESLDYSEKTIQYMKKRIEEVLDELKSMLAKQYESVVTLEDYFELKNDFGLLHLTENKSLRLSGFIEQKDVDLSKYKYSMFKTPSDSRLFDLFFKVTIYGKKETKSSWRDKLPRLERTYKGIKNIDNMFFADGEYKATRIKQSYLRNEFGRFYLITKADLEFPYATVCEIFNVHFDDRDAYLNSQTYQQLLDMQEEYFAIVRKYGLDYNTVEVPEDYKMDYGRKALPADILKTTIPAKLGYYSKVRIKIQNLVDFKGKIFYGTVDDEGFARICRSVFCDMFESKYLADDYSTWNSEGFGKKKGIMFITVAKNNLKYFEYCKNAYPINQFYMRIVRRKEDMIVKHLKNEDVRTKYSNLEDFYKGEFFKELAPTWGGKMDKVKSFVENLSDDKMSRGIYSNIFWLKKHIDMSKIDLTPEEKIVRKHLDAFVELEKKNTNSFKFISIPYRVNELDNDEKELLIKLLKTVMSFK